MRAYVAVLLIGILGLFAQPSSVEGQYRNNPLGTAERYGQLRLRGRVGGVHRAPQTYEQRQYQGAVTRTGRLRHALPIAPRRQWLLFNRQLPRGPMSAALESHNLLRARSTVGQRAVDWFGRSGASVAADRTIEEGTPAGLSPIPLPGQAAPPQPLPAQAGEGLETLLNRRAEELFELGLSYFRHRDWGEADRCFTIVRILEHDRPRGYVADVFVSFQKQYYARAMASLLRALQLADTSDDLKIAQFVERMYEGENAEAKRREFLRTVEAANMLAVINPDVMHVSLLQAYFSWLNGDLGTATGALNRAAKSVEDETVAQRLEKFRTMLNMPTGSQPATSPGNP